MSQATSPRSLLLKVDPESEASRATLGALASVPRLRILELLSDKLLNLSEIATCLDMPLATAVLHINALEKAGLITTERRPAKKGTQKVCTRAYDNIVVQLPQARRESAHDIVMSMPIGAFVDCYTTPTCGLASDTGIIGFFDDPASFYEPERYRAQLLWFHQGYVEYRFPNRIPHDSALRSVQISMELCSEAPLHHASWPSDITVWLNGHKLGSWTSPGDFGGHRGALTPEWWGEQNSQYGLLKAWSATPEGSFVDGVRLSDTSLDTIDLTGPYISVRVGVCDDARHVGGVNLFGCRFGNYAQDIVLRVR